MADKKDNPYEEPVEIDVGPAAAASPTNDEGQENTEENGEVAVLETALAAAEQNLANHKDAMLRMQAEMENLRKRLIRDLERSRKFALEGIMKDFLQVRDSLQQGLDVDPDSMTVEALREGQALTLKMLSKVLEDHDLEMIDPQGKPFNPEYHEAMTVMPSEELEENMVMEVLQKGFRLHDRLIRPARVVVSRKP